MLICIAQSSEQIMKLLFNRRVVFVFYSLLMSLVVKPQSNQWTYIQVDDSKTKWGDYPEATPEWLRYFGLDMGDVNGDGYQDILTGRWVYLNPGSDMTGSWQRVDLRLNVDGILMLDVDNDPYPDIIAQALPALIWLEATNEEGTEWESRQVATIPETSHRNSQGFLVGEILDGGRPEIIIAGNGNLWSVQIPDDVFNPAWKTTLIARNTSDEGIGIGDFDRDGDLDLVAGRKAKGEDEPTIVVWFENPGDSYGDWQGHELGNTTFAADRFGVADFDGDGLLDVLVCEERYPGKDPDAHLYWYRQVNIKENVWDRKLIHTQYSSNNLEVVDLDKDGDMDFLTAEHKGPNLELQFWSNDGKGNFSKGILDTGKESHLGVQVTDMDRDGDLDIVSIGWDLYQFVHMWRNDQ